MIPPRVNLMAWYSPTQLEEWLKVDITRIPLDADFASNITSRSNYKEPLGPHHCFAY
jgi:hypothetical protein